MSKAYRACWTLVALSGIAFHPAVARSASDWAVSGVIYDAESGEPVAYTTVQVEGSGKATQSNAEGQYRILTDRSHTRLKFSHIAYYSHRVQVDPTDSLVVLDVQLQPSVIEGDAFVVTTRAHEPGMRIIREAIKRKKDILSRIHDYRFDAYAKMVVRDVEDPDSQQIWFLTETQSTSFWEQPGKYKEVITARRQTANFDAQDNLISVGEILNFNLDRIEVGRYSIVSPTATDALDHYHYYLLDTVLIDSVPTFRLELEPKDPAQPLFVGFLHIVDSTFDVVDVDVGFSKGVEFTMLSELRYSQRFANFQDEYWMPIEIRLSGRADLEILIPGVPKSLNFVHAASVSGYAFDLGHKQGTFDEVLIEVADGADDFDSTEWYARQSVPLTGEELGAYHRIDSVKNLPTPAGKLALQALGGSALLAAGLASDIYRFNRVESVFLGFGSTLRLSPKFDARLKLGYSFGTKQLQQHIGITYYLANRLKMRFGADYRLRTVTRPSFTTRSRYNPSALALLAQVDPFNYYGTQEVDLWFSFRPFKHSRLRLGYYDAEHSSQAINSDYRVFSRDTPVRQNPTIDDGRMRSLSASLRYDSRPLYRQASRDYLLGTTEYTRVTVGVEHASPELIDNDFDFSRIYAQLTMRKRISGLGLSTLNLFAGDADGTLPAQRLFGADFGNGVFFEQSGFGTLFEQTFGGTGVVAARLHHDFRRSLFTKSGLPLVKDIPFWLSVHGGIMWADFANLAPLPGDALSLTTEKPYSELGFGLGNLTPFLAPLNFSANFTWQLSDYGTSDFVVRLGLGL